MLPSLLLSVGLSFLRIQVTSLLPFFLNASTPSVKLLSQ
jgi:hypothetical protein